jgi:hypothetical protein
MTKQRGPLRAAALTGIVALALTGCAGPKDEPAATPTTPVDPKAALTASTSGLGTGNYAFTEAMPDAKVKGAVHLPSKSGRVEINSTAEDGAGTFELLQVEPDRWVRISIDTTKLSEGLEGIDLDDPSMRKLADGVGQMVALFDGKTWLHTDLSKIKNNKDLNLDLSKADVTGATQLFAGVVTAQGDAHRITGTLDATKATGQELGGFDTDDIKAMGTAARSLPYAAQLDDQGRLSHLEITVPKAGVTPAGEWTIDVTGYGSQQPQQKPTGAVKEMPDSAYKMINN